MTPQELGRLSEGGRSGTWVWGGKSYYVQFNANGGTGEMETRAANVGTDFVIPANRFENDTDFLGWALTAGGELDDASLEHFEQCLLDALMARVGGNRVVLAGFPRNLVELVEVDDAVFGALDVLVCRVV